MKITTNEAIAMTGTDIEGIAQCGVSPTMFIREADASRDVIENYGRCYGHIPKGLSGQWPEATAQAIIAFFDGDLDVVVAENLELVQRTVDNINRSPKHNRSVENFCSAQLLCMLLGRIPSMDNVLLWRTGGTTLVTFDRKFKSDLETLRDEWLTVIGQYNGTVMATRYNIGSRVASTDEVEAEQIRLLPLLSDGNPTAMEQWAEIMEAQCTGTQLVITTDGKFVASNDSEQSEVEMLSDSIAELEAKRSELAGAKKAACTRKLNGLKKQRKAAQKAAVRETHGKRGNG